MSSCQSSKRQHEAARGKPFSKYLPEEERSTTQRKPAARSALPQILKAWSKVVAEMSEWGSDDYYDTPKETYEMSLPLLRRLRYGPREAMEFCICDDMRSGVPRQGAGRNLDLTGLEGAFISALINAAPQKEWRLSTAALEKSDFLCYRLKRGKSVTIEGDVGSSACYEMEGGNVVIEGNAGDAVANTLKGGTVMVKGDAGEEAGSCIRGGMLIVEGNAGGQLGCDMQGGLIRVLGDAGKGVCATEREPKEGRSGCGEVHIQGSFASIADGTGFGGKIFHNGELIFDGSVLRLYENLKELLKKGRYGEVFKRYEIKER